MSEVVFDTVRSSNCWLVETPVPALAHASVGKLDREMQPPEELTAAGVLTTADPQLPSLSCTGTCRWQLIAVGSRHSNDEGWLAFRVAWVMRVICLVGVWFEAVSGAEVAFSWAKLEVGRFSPVQGMAEVVIAWVEEVSWVGVVVACCL